jgi:hypothetical protein
LGVLTEAATWFFNLIDVLFRTDCIEKERPFPNYRSLSKKRYVSYLFETCVSHQEKYWNGVLIKTILTELVIFY